MIGHVSPSRQIQPGQSRGGICAAYPGGSPVLSTAQVLQSLAHSQANQQTSVRRRADYIAVSPRTQPGSVPARIHSSQRQRQQNAASTGGALP